jgi:hypothetical protein
MALGKILLENLALDATLSTGSWSGTLDNVLDPRITSLPARCADPSDLGASKITLTWPSAQYMTDIMICGHTGDLDAKYRITAFEAETPLHTGEWTDFYGRLYDTVDLPFEQGNWYTGKPRLQDIAGYARHKHIKLPAPIAADQLVIEFDVTAQAGDDDFDVGYLIVANPLAPEWNYAWGRQLGIRRRTLVEYTAGGRLVKTLRTNARNHTVTFPSLSKAEAMRLYDFSMADDIHPGVFLPDDEDVIHGFREVFPAHMTATGEPRQVDETGDWSVTLNFEEMQG